MSIRSDGRAEDQLREIAIDWEGLDRADGSARISFGTTSALASVSGPIEARPALLLPSQTAIDLSIRPLAGIAGTDSRALAGILRAVVTPSIMLTRNPRTMVQIVVQALSPTSLTKSGSKTIGDGLVAAMINSTTLALLSAGSVPLSGIVCAVSVARLRPPPLTSGTGAKSKSKARGARGLLVLDESEDEADTSAASGCFAFLFSTALDNPSSQSKGGKGTPPSAVVWSTYRLVAGGGDVPPIDEDELEEAKELARRGAQKVWLEFKRQVRVMGAPKGRISLDEDGGSEGDDEDDEDSGGAGEDESEDDDAKMEI